MAEGRIIFVNRVYWPSEAATAQLLTDLAQGLAARGHDIHVITAGTGSRHHRGVSIHHLGGGAEGTGIAGRALAHLRFLLRARGAVRRLTAPGDVVVLMTDPPLLAPALTGGARRRGASVVQWIQDVYPEIVPQHAGGALAPLFGPLKAGRDRAWLASAACVVVGEDMRRTVEGRGIVPGRIFHVPNWAPRELDVPAGGDRIAARRADWDLSGKFTVAYSGNLGRVHEFATLLDAAERLKAKRGIVFLFVGGGPRIGEVRARAAGRRLGNVRFVRSVPREDLPAALAAPDLHTVALRPGFEGLVNPSKLAGILAAGRPALFIGPSQSAIPALLARTGAGLSFAPGDGAALADAIVALRSDPGRAAEMAAAARAAYVEGFRFEEQLAAWESLLAPLAHRANGIAPAAKGT